MFSRKHNSSESACHLSSKIHSLCFSNSYSITKICINSKNNITLDKMYAETELGFARGVISSPLHIYNGSNVALHAVVTAIIELSGSSTIKTGFGAEISGGLVLRGRSTGKLMDGTRISGRNSGTAVSVRGGSSIVITGGVYGEGDSDPDVGLSLSTDGIDSRIEVRGGTFFGGWFIGGLSSIYVHGCDFTLNGSVLQGFLSDDTALDVVVKANGLLYFVDECPDVIGGLEEEIGMVWSSGSVSPCLVHMLSIFNGRDVLTYLCVILFHERHLTQVPSCHKTHPMPTWLNLQ